MTDRFFGMRTDADTLKIYELKHLPPRIAAMADKCIDKFVKSDLKSEYPGLERSRYSFTEAKWIPTSVLSEGVCSAAYSISPCYEDFERFVAGNRTQVSSGNHDLATLLYIAENGYAASLKARADVLQAVVYRGKRVRRICSRRRVASFQTSGVLLRGGVETPGLRPGAYGKPAIDARLRVRCLAAAGP